MEPSPTAFSKKTSSLLWREREDLACGGDLKILFSFFGVVYSDSRSSSFLPRDGVEWKETRGG